MGLWITGASMHATQLWHEVDFQKPSVIVVGNEGSGIREHTEKQCDYLVKIPMQGKIDSLNVSVATGIMLFETVRQRF